jgi:N6-L-threonylcarbamoyladenine synthase
MKLMGRTLDDAAGEAFDKIAKLLNLPYPGGVLIDALAQLGTVDSTLFSRPYLDNQNLDFSFSGLKTAVAKYIAKHPELCLPSMPTFEDALQYAKTDERLCSFCASFNWTIAETLRKKMERALKRMDNCQALIVAGGVAANKMIRSLMHNLAADRDIRILLPRLGLCTDNAAMIAYNGELLFREGWYHTLDVDAVPRGQKVPWDYLQLNQTQTEVAGF